MIKNIIIFVIGLFIFTNLYGKSRFSLDNYKAEKNFKTGVYYYNETKFAAAIEYFVKSLEYNPKFYLAKIWLGKAYFKAGYIDNAIEEWKDAISSGGGDNFTREKLNNIFFKLGNPLKFNFIKPYIHLKTINGYRYDSKRFIQPISVYVDYNNDIYVEGFASGFIVKLNQNGELLTTITGGKKSFKNPFGMVVDSDDNIIVSDVKTDYVQKISKNGKGLWVIGGSGTADGKFLGPEGVAVDKENNIYVVDSGNCRVQKFDSAGNFLMKFGTRGDEEGEFLKPSGITIDKYGNIYVSDNVLKTIQKFDNDGNFINFFNKKRFNYLRKIKIDKDFFFIPDGYNGAYIYNFLNDTWFNLKTWNYNKNRFEFVSDIFLDKDSTLYISDFYKNTVELFVPEKYKYSNLDLDIEYVDTASYPRVVVYAGVYKKDGTPISGLTKKNFKLKELGVPIFPIALKNSIYNENKIKTIFLVEKSLIMKNYTDELIKAADYYMQDIYKNYDLVKVVNFHKVIWTGIDYTYKKLKINKVLKSDNYYSIKDVSLPLYKSITELMNKHSRKALIFFTSGGYDMEKNFKKYEWQVCMNYAKNNHVPIFIINFTDKNKEKLKTLAETSGGKYYYFFKDINKIKKIRQQIIKIPQNQYILIYETVKDKKFKGTWREIELQVNFNKLTGRDKIGYFIPE